MADAMERGCSYHAMFIYNKPKLKNNRYKDQDFEVSFNIVKFAVDKLASWGFRQTYYHDRDALPGSNIFGEFFDTVKASRFTVVVLTRGFLKDCWGKYKSQAAFSKLLDQGKSKRFIALHVDLDDQQIPEEFITMNSLSFSANWQHEEEGWENFHRLLINLTKPVQDTGPDLFPVTHNNSGSQKAILNSSGTLQHNQEGLAGNNSLVGLQDTNPPNLPTGILETDAGPHGPTEIENLQPVNQNTTNSSDNGNLSNQQSGGGNQHSLGFSVTQSNDSSVIYQRNSTNGLNSNNSASVAIATNPTSTTTASQHVENSQNTTQTGVGLTSSVATPPNTVVSTTGINMEENITLTQGAQAVASTSTTTQTSGTRAQAVSSTSTTMKTSGTRMPPDDAATLTNSPILDAHSDTNLKNIVGRDNGDEDYIFSSLNRNDVELDNSGQSISNSTDNQMSNNAPKIEIKKGHTIPWQSDHMRTGEQLVQSKDEIAIAQQDRRSVPSLNVNSIATDCHETYGSNMKSIGMKRLIVCSPPVTNSSDGYISMDESTASNKGASFVLSTMRRMLPAARSTMRSTMETMFKHSVNFVQKCDQSFI